VCIMCAIYTMVWDWRPGMGFRLEHTEENGIVVCRWDFGGWVSVFGV